MAEAMTESSCLVLPSNGISHDKAFLQNINGPYETLLKPVSDMIFLAPWYVGCSGCLSIFLMLWLDISL
jgi:hypothetical protein